MKSVYDEAERCGLGREGERRGESTVISKARDYNWPCQILFSAISTFHFRVSEQWLMCVIINDCANLLNMGSLLW